MNRFSKKMKVAVGVVALTMVAAGAYAFWTGGGSGDGTATVASGGTATLVGTVAPGLAPGLNRAVTFTALNGSTAPIQIDTLHMDSIVADDVSCLPADFSMADVLVNQQIPVSATPTDLTAAGSLVMANSGLNQDACKGAALTLTLSST
jgi:hypothetical protein